MGSRLERNWSANPLWPPRRHKFCWLFAKNSHQPFTEMEPWSDFLLMENTDVGIQKQLDILGWGWDPRNRKTGILWDLVLGLALTDNTSRVSQFKHNLVAK